MATDNTTDISINLDEKKWYAIRVTYNREMKVKAELETMNVEHFLPMQYKEVMQGERKVRILKPSIHNLIFIYATKDEIIDYKMSTALPIRYIMDRETNRPMIIPERQMRNFIAVAGTYDEQIIYLECNPTNMKRGERVRITGGIFAGAEGEFIRVKGDRRVVVTIPGVAAVATAFIHPSLIEKISDN